MDVNLSVGSIFGIYKNEFNAKNIVASVYVVFGPRVEMVVTIDDVKMYRLQNDLSNNRFLQPFPVESDPNPNPYGIDSICCL